MNYRIIVVLILFCSGRNFIYAQSAEPGSPNRFWDVDTSYTNIVSKSELDVLVETDAAYEIRKPSNEKIKRYLDDPELNYSQKPDIDKNWIERIYDWINRQIRSLMQSKAYSVFIDYLIYILMIAALLVIIIGLLKSDIRGFLYGNVEKNVSGISEKIEDINKIDFNKLIANSLEQGDYKLAVRYNYLSILRSLSNVGLLNLREFKTSSQLVNELKNRDNFYEQFKYLTNIFENTWYGNHIIDTEFYNNISKEFDQFNNLVRENG